jgi:hypothetical protein
MTLMGTETQLRRTNWSQYYETTQFVVALGFYGLTRSADRAILAPLLLYKGLPYRSA